MALLFKKPCKEKGIIIFTHKEWNFFQSNENAYNLISSLKQNYYLGYNSGAYSKKTILDKNVDFHLGHPSYVNVVNCRECEMIPLYDGNFISKEFKNLDFKERYFDITAISTMSKLKRNRELLFAIKKSKLKLKSLFIILTSEYDNSIHQDFKLKKIRDDLFNEEEKERITFIKLSSDLAPRGLSKSSINWFLNQSKFFYAGSDFEGGNRASKEAILAGAKVIYYKFTKSGIPIGLNSENSLYFSSYKNINDTIDEGLKNFKAYKTKGKDYQEFSSLYTIDKIRPFLDKYFDDSDIISKIINYDNLSVDLPAHNLNVPWYIENSMSSDLMSIKQIDIFFKYLKNEKITRFLKNEKFISNNSFSNTELLKQILINIRNNIIKIFNEKK